MHNPLIHNLIVVGGFFLMILAPCAFAIFSSRDPQDARPAGFKSINPGRSNKTAGWRIPRPSTFSNYDLVLEGSSSRSRETISQPAFAAAPTYAGNHAPQLTQDRSPQRSTAANSLLGIAADAEAHSIAAQVYAAQANKNAATAMARAAAARAAAATALAVEAERAVAEATRMAAAVRRAYETAPPSIGPEKHALPESHPSMDFPRSHVIRRAA